MSKPNPVLGLDRSNPRAVELEALVGAAEGATQQGSPERKEALERLVAGYGGFVSAGGPCSTMRAAGADWVSYTYTYPDWACTEETRRRREQRRLMWNWPTFRRVQPMPMPKLENLTEGDPTKKDPPDQGG